jgi:ribosomal protein L2
MPEPTRTAHVALVGSGSKLRYILATENMKPGDLITTSSELTRIAGKGFTRKENDQFR